MSRIRPLGGGRYQADVSDRRRGIPRTKRTFTGPGAKKRAEEWVAAVLSEAHNRLLGRRPRRLFGEALSRYLREHSPQKKSHISDLRNAKSLRHPAWDGRKWIRLEETWLDDMVPALATWIADQRLVLRRRYIGDEFYQQRLHKDVLTWFRQPDPGDGSPPQRVMVTDQSLIAELDKPGGRGPFTADTLRLRQALVSRVLKIAWRSWDWLEHDIAGKIEFVGAGDGREEYLTHEELNRLVAAARDKGGDPVAPHFADAILGAALIGWRRQNVLGLTWDRVIFPIYERLDGAARLVQPGIILCQASTTKTKKPIAQPIGDDLLTLLKRRWELRQGHYVFHQGDGQPFGDFRYRWTTAKKRAGIDPGFRWHDLRHTWASGLLQSGATDRELQELGGWGDAKMVKRYAHLRVDHLLPAVNRPRRNLGDIK